MQQIPARADGAARTIRACLKMAESWRTKAKPTSIRPAVVIELKYDKTTDTAISQIKNKHYPEKVAEYTGDLLLCGISYDRDAKTHSCQIEHWTV